MWETRETKLSLLSLKSYIELFIAVNICSKGELFIPQNAFFLELMIIWFTLLLFLVE